MIIAPVCRVNPINADSSIDYSKTVEFDYSHLNEESMEISHTRDGMLVTYVTFARGLTCAVNQTYIGDGESSTYAVVWDPIDGKPVQMQVSSTYQAEQGYISRAEVDATSDVKSSYTSYLKAKEEEKRSLELAGASEQKLIFKGDFVRIIRGRKYPIGLCGKVFGVYLSVSGERVGITVKDPLVGPINIFTSRCNVEVISEEAQPIEQ